MPDSPPPPSPPPRTAATRRASATAAINPSAESVRSQPPPAGEDGGNGRPQRETTANRLLVAARGIFAKRGYDGASIRAVTREAGANLGAVTYHFGSKRALYEAVLESVLRPLAERVVEIAHSRETALRRVEGVVRAFFSHLAKNPDQPQLMLQEIAAGKRPPAVIRTVMPMVLGSLSNIVEDGQKEGSIRAGDPLLMSIGVVSQPIQLTLVRRLAKPSLGLDQEDPETYARVIEHAVRFVLAALSTEGEERR